MRDLFFILWIHIAQTTQVTSNVKLLVLDFWWAPPIVQGPASPGEKSIRDESNLVKIPELQIACHRRDVSHLKPIHRLSTWKFQFSTQPNMTTENSLMSPFPSKFWFIIYLHLKKKKRTDFSLLNVSLSSSWSLTECIEAFSIPSSFHLWILSSPILVLCRQIDTSRTFNFLGVETLLPSLTAPLGQVNFAGPVCSPPLYKLTWIDQ